MKSEQVKLGVILLAHGTRTAEASSPLFKYAQKLSELIQLPVEAAFREFIRPALGDSVDKLVKREVDRIVVLPFFLFKSAHAGRDVAADVKLQAERYPDINFAIGEPLGFDQLLVQLLKKRLEQIAGPV